MGKVLSPTWFETRFFKSLRNIQMETFLLYCRHGEEKLIFFVDLHLPCLCSGGAQANCTHPSFLFLMLPSEMRFQLSWFGWGHSWCRVWRPTFWEQVKHRRTFWRWSATFNACWYLIGDLWPLIFPHLLIFGSGWGQIFFFFVFMAGFLETYDFPMSKFWIWLDF